MNDNDVNLAAIDSACERVFNSTTEDDTFEAIKDILSAYLNKYEDQFSGWPERELYTIIEEAFGFKEYYANIGGTDAWDPEIEIRAERYFFDDSEPYAKESNTSYFCTHNPTQCSCWFKATPSAGITGFPEHRKRNRKPCVQFIHNLIVELLIFLTAWGAKNKKLNSPQQWALHWAILGNANAKLKNQSLGFDDDFTEDNQNKNDAMDEDKERFDFLENDTMMYDMATGLRQLYYDWSEDADDEGNDEGNVEEETNDEVEEDEEDPATAEDDCFLKLTGKERQFLQLLGMIARRSLTLAVSRWGKASLFKRRVRTYQWNFQDLMDAEDLEDDVWDYERFIKPDPRSVSDETRYPFRVIDTETYNFEGDQTLFGTKYAILSHTWIQTGKEVEYGTIKKFMAAEKEKKIRTDLAREQGHLRTCEEDPEVYNVAIREIKEIIKSLNEELEVLRVDAQKEKDAREFEKKQQLAKNPTKADQKKRNLTANTPAKEGAGFAKLRFAIEKARELGYQYLWVDSCCIDKPNNGELVESISNMGAWYKNAEVCLTYVDDFAGDDLAKAKKPRWSTRGWTLQEVVMSKRVIFFNKAWKQICDTDDPDLNKEDISKAVNVPARLIASGGEETKRMAASLVLALAQDRKTFKPEDRAYALMGLLNVRIMPDYGEGLEKALSRLIDEVLRSTRDISVFNWTRNEKTKFYPGSKEQGKSLYPIDFSGYDPSGITLLREAVDKDDQSWLVPDNDTMPVIARSEIGLGTSGVNARFDIYQTNVTVQGDNEKAYEVVQKLKIAEAENGVKINCVVDCVFENPQGDPDLEIKVYCSVDALEKQLRVELGKDPSLTSAWVIARFSRAYGANWFLVALEFDPQLSEYGLFKERFSSQKLAHELDDVEEDEDAPPPRRGKVGDFSHFMHYIESDGFPATRIETDTIERSFIPMDDDDNTADPYIKNINLWVG